MALLILAPVESLGGGYLQAPSTAFYTYIYIILLSGVSSTPHCPVPRKCFVGMVRLGKYVRALTGAAGE